MTKAAAKKPEAKTPAKAAPKEVAKKTAAPAKTEKAKAAAPAPKAAAKPAPKTKQVEKVFDTKTAKKPQKPVVTTESISRKFQQNIIDNFS